VAILAADIAMNGWGRATRYRAAGEILLTVGLAAALWFYVFPWASLHLPIDSSGFTG
jgi:hypothetical protein